MGTDVGKFSLDGYQVIARSINAKSQARSSVHVTLLYCLLRHNSESFVRSLMEVILKKKKSKDWEMKEQFWTLLMAMPATFLSSCDLLFERRRKTDECSNMKIGC